MGSGHSTKKFQSQAMEAIQRGDTRKFDKLVQAQKKKYGLFGLSYQDTDGSSLIHSAVSGNSISAVRILVDAGVNPNLADKQGNTPLHLAISNHNEDMVTYLLNNGADKNAKVVDSQMTPLMVAVTWQAYDIVGRLVEAGVDVNIPDKNKQTPLHKAVNIGDERLVRTLIAHHADILARDDVGRTPALVAKTLSRAVIQKLLSDKFCTEQKALTPTVFSENKTAGKSKEAKRKDSPDDSTTTTEETKGDDSKCCKVCWENSADTVVLWCGHVAVCMYCSQYMQQCPICCSVIEKVQRVFIS